MITKACTNRKCSAYAHFIYTLDTRCVLCRWDLRALHAGGNFSPRALITRATAALGNRKNP